MIGYLNRTGSIMISHGQMQPIGLQGPILAPKHGTNIGGMRPTGIKIGKFRNVHRQLQLHVGLGVWQPLIQVEPKWIFVCCIWHLFLLFLSCNPRCARCHLDGFIPCSGKSLPLCQVLSLEQSPYLRNNSFLCKWSRSGSLHLASGISSCSSCRVILFLPKRTHTLGIHPRFLATKASKPTVDFLAVRLARHWIDRYIQSWWCPVERW